MKIGVELPHSLTLSLCVTANAVSDQDVNLNSFVVLCEIEDATDILDNNFYDDLICIFQVNVLEKNINFIHYMPAIFGSETIEKVPKWTMG